MRTWSLESVFHRVVRQHGAALEKLRRLEQLTRPQRVGAFTDYDDSFFDAALGGAHVADGAEQLADKEAEEECSAPVGHVCVECLKPAHWNSISAEAWYHHDGSDVCQANKPDEKLLVVPANIPNPHSHWCMCPSCMPPPWDVKADKQDAAMWRATVGMFKKMDPTASPADAVSTGDGGEAVSAEPPSAPASPPLQTWLEPAVWTALTPHEPTPEHYDTGQVYCCGERFGDWQAWRQHVAPSICDRITKALPDFPGEALKRWPGLAEKIARTQAEK